MDAIEKAAISIWATQTSIYSFATQRDYDKWKTLPEKDRKHWEQLAYVALKAAFSNADAKDWLRLDSMIDQSGHGKFWRAIMSEIPKNES